MCSVECADVEEEKDEVFSTKFLKIFLHLYLASCKYYELHTIQVASSWRQVHGEH